MQRIFFLILVLIILSCKTENKQKLEKDIVKTDNTELIEIYQNDQADRQAGENIDWSVVSKKDSLREVRVYQLLDSNKVKTSKDYRNAAMIFQHGGDSTAYGMAVELMRKSIELDSTADKWLLAAAIDRYLLSKDEPQIYGTQYNKYGKDESWQIAKMDTAKISDAERIEYGVETLAEQKEKVKRINQRKLSELLSLGKSTDEIIKIIKSESKENSKFNISENEINNLGHKILEKGKNKEALKIFKLNTELYPKVFNAWECYGECLLILGKKAEGIKAYKKSLELNPENENAETIIAENNKA
jgi:tetratricopeptide (TPR) repeat protein